MPTTTEQIRVRIDKDLKEQAESVLDSMGLSFSTAVQLFLKQTVMRNELPFEVKADPLYSEANMKRIMEAIGQLDRGQGKTHALIEDEAE